MRLHDASFNAFGEKYLELHDVRIDMGHTIDMGIRSMRSHDRYGQGSRIPYC